MKILVTGGAGFIGSHIVDAYIEAGHNVWVIDDESAGKRAQIHPKAVYTRLDVSDVSKLRRYFKGKRFDVVNHHAAQIDVRRSVVDPLFDARVNVLGTLNLLEESRLRGVRKFILPSSGGTVYGECNRPAGEDSPEIPVSPYGVAKLAAEKYVRAYQALYGLRFTIFRYANVYGPRQDPHGEAGVVAIFSQRLLAGESVYIFGTGRQTRDFVYVGDVVDANVRALRSGVNTVVNIGTQRETSILELHKEMAGLLNIAKKPLFRPKRAGELNRSVLANGLAEKLLGWKPQHSLNEGLQHTISYFASAPV